MKTIQLTIDAELGEEYCRKYREVFPNGNVADLDDKGLLKASIHDRLTEEISFLDDQLDMKEL